MREARQIDRREIRRTTSATLFRPCFGGLECLFFFVAIFISRAALTESNTMNLQHVRITLRGDWAPSALELAALETALVQEFSRAAAKLPVPGRPQVSLSAYGRQYTGILSADEHGTRSRKTIQVIGFCRLPGLSEEQLQTTPLAVEDGGSCYFTGVFTPSTGKFEQFTFNGDA